MLHEHDVSVYKRNIQLEIVIPEEHVWEFMSDFGEEFATEDDIFGKTIKTIDHYYPDIIGWHVAHPRGEKVASCYHSPSQRNILSERHHVSVTEGIAFRRSPFFAPERNCLPFW